MSIDKQIRHLINDKGVSLKGERQRAELRLMGYYHGYKGYRFFRTSENPLIYSDFAQLKAVYDFDSRLKALIYPVIMLLETALKNYTVEEIIERVPDGSFDKIYSQLMTDYKRYPIDSREFREAREKRSEVRKKIYGVINREYPNKPLVRHFYNSGRKMPIWAIFELLTLGEFSSLLETLGNDIIRDISANAGIDKHRDKSGRILCDAVDAVKDLRNAVAHNDAVFDGRFQVGESPSPLKRYVESAAGVNNVDFRGITDYILLLCGMLKGFEACDEELAAFSLGVDEQRRLLKERLPKELFNKIITEDEERRLNAVCGGRESL